MAVEMVVEPVDLLMQEPPILEAEVEVEITTITLSEETAVQAS